MMADLIDRQAVQEIVDRIGDIHPYRQIGNRESYSQYNEAWTDAINRVDAELNSLPSAQPERKNGQWIPQDHNKINGMTSTAVYYYPKCSVCGYCAYPTNFCPNCGADMRGEQDG